MVNPNGLIPIILILATNSWSYSLLAIMVRFENFLMYTENIFFNEKKGRKINKRKNKNWLVVTG